MQLRQALAVRPGEPDGCGAWTADRFDGWLRSSYDGEPAIVLTQGAPGADGHLEPLMRTSSDLWISHEDPECTGSTSREHPFLVNRLPADGADSPPGGADSDKERACFLSFANEALWPLCHRAHVKPAFRVDDFTSYWRANAAAANAVSDEASGPAPLFFVNDYHFALAPLRIRERHPHSRIVMFWQIPWPDWQAFDICPWSRHLLEGLLGSSIVGFQTPLDCRNFVETVERCLGAHVDRHHEAITYDGRQVLVRAYPASVRWPGFWTSCSPGVEICRDSIRRQLRLTPDVRLGVGVDGLDQAKGLEEKLLTIERLLECYPELRTRFVFAQLLAPHRAPFPGTCELRVRLRALRDRINARFGAEGYTPLILIESDHAPSHVNMFLRAADFCYVGSLHEGMNLVAKEFVAARDDEAGVLVLSAFAGAGRELTDALMVNPYDIDESAAILAQALAMPADEQRTRMRQLRSVVAEFSAWRWTAQILSDAARLRRER